MAIKIIPTTLANDNYVFIPAACYAGNQFEVNMCSYPPMFTPQQARLDMPVTITNVPRLEKDGRGKIEVTTGDAAVPCIGVFSKQEGRGVLVFTVQELEGENIGLAYEAGDIRLTWPAKRENVYSMTTLSENETPWNDKPAEIPCNVLDFPCESLAQFYQVFFENRKCMGLDTSLPDGLSLEKQKQIQLKKFNTLGWHETKKFYMVGTDKSHFQVWQPGWVGGAMSSYALMALGGEKEWQRGISTLEFLFANQGESGFFYGIVDYDGNRFGDGFDKTGTEQWHLIRKSADVLYFLFKHFNLIKEAGDTIPQSFIDGARKCADAFVKLWDDYGQFGQFSDVITGELIVGGSTSAGIAPAALVAAYHFLGDDIYLITAKQSGQDYYENHLCKGYTTGGPGEILQCPDSESAFALLESFVLLYDETKSPYWLECAKECAHFCSSWVVAYNYTFPQSSEFARLGMKSIGSVFANVQNKHSAPGICTLSGDSLYKLYQWTEDSLYLDLIREIALGINQYMSTTDRPIYDRDRPDGDDAKELEQHRLPSGLINERVNLSDWEGTDGVGGVFNGTCWSEVSNLLTMVEVFPQDGIQK